MAAGKDDRVPVAKVGMSAPGVAARVRVAGSVERAGDDVGVADGGDERRVPDAVVAVEYAF